MSKVLAFPGRKVEAPRVYLAGKMELGGWRTQVVPGISEGLFGSDPQESWPTVPFNVEGIDAQYVGPYFIDCGHGCYFGTGQHGFGVQQEEYENCGAHSSATVLEAAAARRAYVSERCMRGIRSADLVFAWLDDLTAFGTILEIGFARGLPGKTIVIGTPDRVADLWFVYEQADAVVTSFSAAEALSRVLRSYVDKGSNPATWVGNGALLF